VAFPGRGRSPERSGRQLGAQLRHQGEMLLAMRYPRGQWLDPFIELMMTN
jgi:hypothetical protein